MRSFGDSAYGVFQGLQKENISSAREELSQIIGYNTEELTESGVIRATVLAVAGNIAYGVVAPLLYLSLGGVPLAMAYKGIDTLYLAIGKTDPLYRGWGFASAKLYNFVHWLPARITGVFMVIGAAFLFGTGSKAFMILIRKSPQQASPRVGIPEAVLAGAIGMTLRLPLSSMEALPNQTLVGDEINEAQLQNIKDAIKLMGAVACIMLILCMVIG